MSLPITQLVKRLDAISRGLDRRVRAARKRPGIAIIEFAFVLPFVFILFFSIVDFGIFFFAQHTLQFATREGARVGLVGRQLVDGAGNTMSREQSIVTTIENFAGIAVDPGKLSISVYPVTSTYADP